MNRGSGLQSKGTNVRVDKTVTDMEGQVYRFDGRDFRHDNRSGYIEFRMDDPDFGWLTFRIPQVPRMPRNEKERMRMYRTGFWHIKGVLAAIADGHIKPAEAFHAFIIDGDGTPLFEKTRHLLPTKTKTVTCHYCRKINRMPADKDITHAICGHCHKPLAKNWRRSHEHA